MTTVFRALLAATALVATVSAHDHYRIVGTVTKMTADEITVKQIKDNALVEMDYDKNTKVIRDGKPARFGDVKVGTSVVIDGYGDDIFDLLVLEIKIVPPIPPAKKPSPVVWHARCFPFLGRDSYVSSSTETGTLRRDPCRSGGVLPRL